MLTNDEIFQTFIDHPAPLLPILHTFHDRDGWLSQDSIRAVSERLRIPLAELYGTVTFYHHFSQKSHGKQAPRVCTGPICRLNGADQILQEMSAQGASEMPCAGRCDDPVPVIVGDEVLVGRTVSELQARPSLLPAPPHEKITECIFAAIREADQATLAGYRASHGYQALERALLDMTPQQVLETVSASGLAGRGGAGFPTGRKWQAVRDAEGDTKSIVCNADEGEPGCFKDRVIMDYDPHAMIEGMALAGYACGAERGFIYLRYEYPNTCNVLERALAEARATGWLGQQIQGSDFDFDIYLVRGAGAYVCGEEGALLNSMEGKHPFPRNRPPYPVTHGFEDKPTAVNNVETLASVPPIIRNGPQWYQGLGLGDESGTKLISLSGDVAKPGNYEVPLGLPLQTLLYEWAGGPLPGQTFQAVTMAGLSGGFLGKEAIEEAALCEKSIRTYGSFLGAGGIMVFDGRRNMVEVARQAMAFFAEESCGKCFPCRIGTERLTERLGGSGPSEPAAWRGEIHDLGKAMAATSACGLGVAAPLVTESLLRFFPDQVEAFLKSRLGNPKSEARNPR